MPHDPAWPAMAEAETARIQAAIRLTGLAIHHIGSTAITGLSAKPVIDLLGAAPGLAEVDAARPALETLGYEWRGENGIPGRRYCTLNDAASGERRVHLHFYAAGDPAVRRHLAFRDLLRARPDLIEDYEKVKRDCAAAHADDSLAYWQCKAAWIARIEAEALKGA